ncbi:MAG: hypothetical protein J6A28_03370 [Clostridia bacterium]|nr:hypothetical protein [Clostridia bacterium]
MEKVTTQRKKLTITIIALCVALLTIVGALIGVFAAETQSVKSEFEVEYTVGTNIAAKITGTYQVGNGTVKSMTTDGQAAAENKSNTDLIFNVNTDNATPGALSVPEDIVLDSTNNYVTLVFTFENLSDTTAFEVTSDWYIDASYTKLFKNITTETTYSNSTYTGSTTPTTGTIDPSTDGIDFSKYLGEPVNAGNTLVVTIKLSIANINQSAYIRTTSEDETESRPLDFMLTQIDPFTSK